MEITRNLAIELLENCCFYHTDVQRNINALDQYDFTDYLSNGLDIWVLRKKIEEDYDNIFFKKYGFYPFEYIDEEQTGWYFVSRYNVDLIEYKSYVIRKKKN